MEALWYTVVSMSGHMTNGTGDHDPPPDSKHPLIISYDERVADRPAAEKLTALVEYQREQLIRSIRVEKEQTMFQKDVLARLDVLTSSVTKINVWVIAARLGQGAVIIVLWELLKRSALK